MRIHIIRKRRGRSAVGIHLKCELCHQAISRLPELEVTTALSPTFALVRNPALFICQEIELPETSIAVLLGPSRSGPSQRETPFPRVRGRVGVQNLAL